MSNYDLLTNKKKSKQSNIPKKQQPDSDSSEDDEYNDRYEDKQDDGRDKIF